MTAVFELMYSVLLAAIVYWVVGFVFVSRLTRQRPLSKLEFGLQSIFLGAFGTSLVQFFGSLMGIGLLETFFATGVGFLVLLLRSRPAKAFPRRSSLFERFSWILLGVSLGFLGMRATAAPMYTWDAVAFWTPKMVALWRDNAVNIDGLKYFNHPEYPLFVPLTGATQFFLQGWPNHIAAKASLFFVAAAGLLTFFAWCWRTFPPLKAFFWSVLLLSLFVLRDHVGGEYAGTADLFVGLVALLGTLRILEGNWRLGLVQLAFLPWVKSEGLVFAGSFLAAAFLFQPLLRRFIIILSSVIILPWQAFIRAQPIDTSQYFKFDEIYARSWLEYAAYSVHAFREEFRQLTKWNMTFWWGAVAVLTHLREVVQHTGMRVIVLALLAQLVVYLFVFTVTPEEQASFIAAAVSRLSLHLAPSVLALAAWLFSTTKRERTDEISNQKS